MAVSVSLTSDQLIAAQCLALGQSHRVTAERVGVTKGTVTRWLKKPAFKQKVEEFKREIEQIEGESFREAAQEVGEDIRKNVKKILTPDELKSMLSEMAEDMESSPMLRFKAIAELGKWYGLAAPKPVQEKDSRDEFPIKDLEGVEDVSSLSDEELQELYLKTLAES